MIAEQPRTAQLEALVAAALGTLALVIAAYSQGAARLIAVVGVAWIISAMWLLNATRKWGSLDMRRRTRVIVIAHICTILPIVALVAGAGSAPSSMSGDEAQIPSDADPNSEGGSTTGTHSR
jgi:hypothetical protein